jgi:hypothetical protein
LYVKAKSKGNVSAFKGIDIEVCGPIIINSLIEYNMTFADGI